MSKLSILDLCKDSHQIAKEHGWWENPDRSPLEVLMLMVTELAEAAEDFRKNEDTPVFYDHDKPEGWLVELADLYIRVGDFVEQRGLTKEFEKAIVDKMKYNQLRSYRHGNKKY